jgi:hypothetical protein
MEEPKDNKKTALDFLHEFIPKGKDKSIIEEWEAIGNFGTPAQNIDMLYNHREIKYQWDYDRDSEGVQDEKGYRRSWLVKEINFYSKGLQEGKWGSSTQVIKQYIQKRKNEISGKPELKFEDLFVKRSHAASLDSFFKYNGFLTGDKFTGRSGNKTELAAVYWVLHGWDIIKKGKFATQAKVFHLHYELEIGTGKDVSMNNAQYKAPISKDYNEYQHWLENLFN